jgi:hypothetical protein
MASSDEFDLVRWDVPFADAELPSVTFLPDPGGLVRVLVSPDGIDRYPKYLVVFDGDVVAYRCEAESFAPPLPADVRREPGTHCACLWLDSPWLRQYEQWSDYFQSHMEGALKHYLVFGGNSVVELLAVGEPTVTPITEPTVLQTTYQAWALHSGRVGERPPVTDLAFGERRPPPQAGFTVPCWSKEVYFIYH